MANGTQSLKDVQIDFVEKKKVDLRGYTLIEGFPGMGLVGTISAKYLTDKCDCKQIGYIDSTMFVPIIRIHKGYPIHPSRIYVNERKKIAVLVSEQIVPQFFTDKLAKAVVDWVKKKKIRRVISLSGVKAPSEKGRSVIYGIASDGESKKALKKYGVEVIKEGITTGVTALIMMELRDEKIEAYSLLGNVQIAADYKAASEILKKLNTILDLNIDVKPLLKEAKEMEQALLEHLKALKKTSGEVKRFEDRTVRTPMTT